MRDFTFALRTLAKTPIVSAIAILSLALGIGANASIFTMFEQTIARVLPTAEPERLVNLTANGPRSGSNSTNNAGGTESIFSYAMFRDLDAGTRDVFEGVAAHRSFGANLSYRGQTMSASGMFVSGNYFSLLRAKPALGNLIGVSDDLTPGSHRVVVLSHGYWADRFGSRSDILNQPLLVNGTLMTIVGVAPANFQSTTLGIVPEIYVPISMREALTPGFEGLKDRRTYWAYLFARLKPGVTLQQAEAAANTKYLAIIREVDWPLQKGASEKFRQRFLGQRMKLEPGEKGQSTMLAVAREPIYLLFSITAFVLLIACANIANLLLARSANRSKEFSVRLSLGATRAQLIRQLLVEAVVLAVIAGVAGLLVAYATSQGIASLLPGESSAIYKPTLTGQTLAFAMGLSVVAGFLFGLFPAYQSTRLDLAGVMKDQAGNLSATRGSTWFRRVMVTGQITLSLLLLISAGLFLRSLVNVMKVDIGLRTERTLTFALAPELNKYTPARSVALFEQVEQRVAAMPGILSVTASMVPLISGNNWGSDVSVDGFQAGPDTDTHSMFNVVGAGFFRAMGVPLVKGREFTTADVATSPKVAIVNEAFVRKFSANGDLLGRRMKTGSGGKNDIEIVGIVKDTKYSEVKGATPPLFFRPYRQDTGIGASCFYVTSAIPEEQVIQSIRRAVAEIDPNLPIENLKTMSAVVSENILVERLISTLAAAFAALATLLAAVGLYGVLSYTVSRRTREIGIRLAIGADAPAIRVLVMKEVFGMIAAGIALGLPAAWVLSKYTESLLFEVQGRDWLVWTGATLLVATISVLAGYLPAQRAMRVEPLTALRYE
jgi:predicted permease